MEEVIGHSQSYSTTLQSYNTTLQADLNNEKAKREEIGALKDLLQGQVAELTGRLKSAEDRLQFDEVQDRGTQYGGVWDGSTIEWSLRISSLWLMTFTVTVAQSFFDVLLNYAHGLHAMPRPRSLFYALKPFTLPHPSTTSQDQVGKLREERDKAVQDVTLLRADLDNTRQVGRGQGSHRVFIMQLGSRALDVHSGRLIGINVMRLTPHANLSN